VAEKGNVSRFAFRISHFAFRVSHFVFHASFSMGGTYVGWVSCSQVCTIHIRARTPGTGPRRAGDRNGLNVVV